MNNEKIRVLICSDPLSQVTGLAYVAGSFARHFIKQSDKYEVGYFTLRGHFSDKIRAVNPDILDPLKIYTPQKDVSLLKDFTETINHFNPHIVLTVADPWDVEVVAFCSLRYSYCWFAYTTIEVPKLYSDRIYSKSNVSNHNFISFFEVLYRADLIIPVTQMAKSALKDLKHRERRLNNIYEENVFNGCDIDLRIKERKSKFDLFRGFIGDNHFLFMTLGVNSERKKIEQSIIVFAKFIEKLRKEKDPNAENIRLYLHTNIHSAPTGTDLRAVMEEYNVKDYVIGMSNVAMAEKEKVYELYSICDVYMGFPGGEGFGYGFCEAMLHGKPVVYIDHGGHIEFAYKGGLPVRVKDYEYAMKLGVKWAVPDVKHAVNQMYKLYKNPLLRNQLGMEGQRHIIENFGWDKIGKQLENIILNFYNKTKDEKLYGLKFKKLG